MNISVDGDFCAYIIIISRIRFDKIVPPNYNRCVDGHTRNSVPIYYLYVKGDILFKNSVPENPLTSLILYVISYLFLK